jgi:Domain of unknown function (DUF222)/HNH endonuclease
MSELRSAIDQLRAEDLSALPDARAEDDFAELQRAAELLEAERLRRLADLDRRGVYRRDGHLSAASWLVTSLRIGWGAAREQVRVARSLEHMPETRRALDEGDLSMSAGRVLVAAREADPEAFDRCEATLVEAARIHSARDLQRVASQWRQMAERDGSPAGEDALRARRRLHASRTFAGMVRVDGDLDPETGEALLTALGAIMDAEARTGAEDTRSPGQRRADALGEVCRQWLDRSNRAAVGGERPHMTVTVDVETLRDLRGSAELDHAGPVLPEVARRIACDASIVRVVTAWPSQPLDVGRRTSVVSPAQRRAVVIRDGHCRFPGCDRPAAWCDAHHIVHWADGGPTSLGNLILLCRRHHTMLHERGGFRLQLENSRPVFRRPDGSVLVDPSAVERAPPLAC